MAETTKTSSGVQELIDRIRDQGVQAAQEEADRLLRHARQQATEIVAQAKAGYRPNASVVGSRRAARSS